MRKRSHFYMLLLLTQLALAACGSGSAEPLADAASQPETEKVSISQCVEAAPGAYQLIYAAQGYCFLYPDNYDVFQGEDGDLTLYVRSLLNTEAPVATLHVEALDGRTVREVVPQYPSDSELATITLLAIDLGEETATVLDNLPGQDISRHVVAVHDDTVYDLMISRIGPDYGPVGEQAEVLYSTITDSFQFIGTEPNAPLLAGPECPEPAEDTMLYTNEAAGYCLLVPSVFTLQEINPDAADNEIAFYVDSLQDVTHARLWVKVSDADSRSLEEITTAYETELETAMPGFDLMYSFGYMLDGEFANQFDQVPGQDLSRQVVMVHGGRYYTLTFIPDDPSAAAYAEMETLYDVVMDSFSFLRQS